MQQEMTLPDGSPSRSVELADAVFNRTVSDGSIYHAVRNELSNSRVGTAKVRVRGEVRGSTKKPWRQKGSGRARAGSRRSPLWRGGGVIFGPLQRDFSYRMPRKQKRVAMMSLLTKIVQDKKLTVIEDFEITSGKTRDLVEKLRPVAAQSHRTVLIVDEGGKSEASAMLKRSARNLPWLRLYAYNRLLAHDLLYCKSVIIMESAVKSLNTFFSQP